MSKENYRRNMKNISGKRAIKIAFHPVEERFEVLNPAILKDKAWVHDIAEIIRPEFSTLLFVRNYQEKKPEASESEQSFRWLYYSGQRATPARACRKSQLFFASNCSQSNRLPRSIKPLFTKVVSISLVETLK